MLLLLGLGKWFFWNWGFKNERGKKEKWLMQTQVKTPD
jgi:hypothetical protein